MHLMYVMMICLFIYCKRWLKLTLLLCLWVSAVEGALYPCYLGLLE
jgi:hypothetical protein